MKILMTVILEMSQELVDARPSFHFSERNVKKNPPIPAKHQSAYSVPVITTAFLKSAGKLQRLPRIWTDTQLLLPCMKLTNTLLPERTSSHGVQLLTQSMLGLKKPQTTKTKKNPKNPTKKNPKNCSQEKMYCKFSAAVYFLFSSCRISHLGLSRVRIFELL